MNWVDARKNPTEPGWYVVRQHLNDKPLVIWWSKESVTWRAGATRIFVDAYIGPLPQHQERPL